MNNHPFNYELEAIPEASSVFFVFACFETTVIKQMVKCTNMRTAILGEQEREANLWPDFPEYFLTLQKRLCQRLCAEGSNRTQPSMLCCKSAEIHATISSC